MDYEFSKLLLKFSQAFIQKDVEQLKSIATQLKDYNDDEQQATIIDILTGYAEENMDDVINTETLQSVLENAGIENYQSFLYYLQLTQDADDTSITSETFKQKPYYTFFMGEQKHINDVVGFNFNNRIALNSILLRDASLISEVLNRIEQIESQP